MGCWTPQQQFQIGLSDDNCKELSRSAGIFWNAELENEHGGAFQVVKYEKNRRGEEIVNKYQLHWALTGLHNVKNALAAVAAAHHVGVDVATAIKALKEFRGVKRRMEFRGEARGVKVYDDFAHHPTAIKLTLDGVASQLSSSRSSGRLIAVIEPRSATMKSGTHQTVLNDSCQSADMVVWYRTGGTELDIESLVSSSNVPAYYFHSVEEIVSHLNESCIPGDTVVIMSNGGFGGIHEQVLKVLEG